MCTKLEQRIDSFYTTSPPSLFNKNRIDVEMMHQTSRFAYYEDDTLQFVSLPYSNKKFSMNIFLPKKNGWLNENTLIETYTKSQLVEVDLTLPKFEFKFELELIPFFKKNGIGTMFKMNEFNNMMDKPAQVISFKNISSIEVCETGTVALSRTEVIMSWQGCSELPKRIKIKEMNVNKPFLFTIHNNELDLICYIGIVNNPLLKK